MTPLSASARASAGTPISVRGIGRIRPRDQRFAVVVAGCTIRSPSPASPGERDGLGAAVEHRLGADVDRDARRPRRRRELAADRRGRPPAPRPRRPGARTTDRGRRRQPGDAAADDDHARGARRRRVARGHTSQIGKHLVTVATGAEPGAHGLRHSGSRDGGSARQRRNGARHAQQDASGARWRPACWSRSAALTACSGGGGSSGDAMSSATRRGAAPAPSRRRRTSATAAPTRRRTPARTGPWCRPEVGDPHRRGRRSPPRTSTTVRARGRRPAGRRSAASSTTSRPPTTGSGRHRALDAGAAGPGRASSRPPMNALDEARQARGTPTQTSKDVTTEVIDVDERVQTLQNSLDRLQRLPARRQGRRRPDPTSRRRSPSGRPSCSR